MTLGIAAKPCLGKSPSRLLTRLLRGKLAMRSNLELPQDPAAAAPGGMTERRPEAASLASMSSRCPLRGESCPSHLARKQSFRTLRCRMSRRAPPGPAAVPSCAEAPLPLGRSPGRKRASHRRQRRASPRCAARSPVSSSGPCAVARPGSSPPRKRRPHRRRLPSAGVVGRRHPDGKRRRSVRGGG